MRLRDRAYGLTAGVAAAFAVLAVGGAFRWTQAVVALFVALALATQWPSRRRLVGLSPLVVLIGIAATLTAFSLIPLPGFVGELLDPVGYGLREDGAELLDLSVWPSASRDPSASLRALVFFVILLGAATAALRLAVHERGRFRLLSAVAVLSGVCALVGTVHEISGATKLYGVLQITAKPNVIAPLLNENHFGSLMALGASIAIGLVFYRRQPSWTRAIWVFVVLLCAALAVASRSRGAAVGLCFGALTTIALCVAQRFASPEGKRRRGLSASSIPLVIVGGCMVLLAVYSSSGGVADRLSRTSLDEIHQPFSRFAAWRSSWKLIDESPWVGVGRGGFEPSFTRVHDASGTITFSHVENEYLQAIVDWGIPGAILIGITLLWAAAVALRRWRDGPLIAAALGGLTAVTIQSNVDFGVELLGLALPVVATAATVLYVPLREGREHRAATRVLRSFLIASLLIGAAVLLSPVTTTIAEDHESLQRPNVTLAEIRSALRRHPLDYYAFARASQVMRDAGDAKAIVYLNHAMRLHPTHPDLHRLAARLLIAGHHEQQATIEYAQAMRATRSPSRLLREIAEAFPPADAAAAIPTNYPDPRLIINTLADMKRDDIASLWLARVVEGHPGEPRTCAMIYEVALRLGDIAAAAAADRHCGQVMPDPQTRFALAKMLTRNNADNQVLRLLDDVESWHGRIDEKIEAWFLLCDAQARLKQWDRASICLRRMDVSGIAGPEQQALIASRLEAIARDRVETASGSAAAPAPTTPAPAPSSPPAPVASPH